MSDANVPATPNDALATPDAVCTGTVWLVGAGPGNPELITVAGLAVLGRADVVVYDRLAAPSLLDAARADAVLIDAGKAVGAHTLSQSAINAVLAEHARAGRTVVRLKGGDPFLFGRGGEEAQYLRDRGIDYRVIPGVTSALAAPAFAGIPVTQRGTARSVLIMTGHESPEGEATTGERDWDAVAHAADTLVVLMGVERLDGITRRLIGAGRPAEQPAALIHWGSTPRQRVLTATLATIAEQAAVCGFGPPATLVVGEVVRLRDHIRWLEQLPLFGARVLVTRTREQASGLVEQLRTLGADPLEFSTISVRPLEDTAALDRQVLTVGQQDWAIFTSQNGVTAVLDRLHAVGGDARAFAGVRICAVGSATARTLAERGLRADLVPPSFTSEGVLGSMIEAGVANRRVVLFQPEIAPPELGDGLRQAGAVVERVTAYRTQGGAGRRADLVGLLAGGVDVITFTSSSTVANLLGALDGDLGQLADTRIVTIGPHTSQAVRAAGLRVDAEAEPHTIEGMVTAIVGVWQIRRSDTERQPR